MGKDEKKIYESLGWTIVPAEDGVHLLKEGMPEFALLLESDKDPQERFENLLARCLQFDPNEIACDMIRASENPRMCNPLCRNATHLPWNLQSSSQHLERTRSWVRA